jgi:hypothetical protein
MAEGRSQDYGASHSKVNVFLTPCANVESSGHTAETAIPGSGQEWAFNSSAQILHNFFTPPG